VPTISLKREEKKPPQPEAPPTQVRGVQQPANPRYRALVADDDPATRYLLATILAKHQIAFDEAANGADAVKFLKNNEYALVFIDLMMPRVDGWGVIDFVRSHPRASAPRVFVVTGVQNQKLSSADQDIVTGMLYKPIDIAVVERLVS